jgi:hypothetical protein
MEGGPWNFRKFLVSIEPYDGFCKPSLVKLDMIEIRYTIFRRPIDL